MPGGTNPDIRRPLGVEGDLGRAVNLDDRWPYDVLEQVGNSAEVRERTIAPLGIPCGIDAPWNEGGLMTRPRCVERPSDRTTRGELASEPFASSSRIASLSSVIAGGLGSGLHVANRPYPEPLPWPPPTTPPGTLPVSRSRYIASAIG